MPVEVTSDRVNTCQVKYNDRYILSIIWGAGTYNEQYHWDSRYGIELPATYQAEIAVIDTTQSEANYRKAQYVTSKFTPNDGYYGIAGWQSMAEVMEIAAKLADLNEYPTLATLLRDNADKPKYTDQLVNTLKLLVTTAMMASI